MTAIFVGEVGDGLTAGFSTLDGNIVGIDCGSSDNSELAWEKLHYNIRPDYFILSHFHGDHYNGFIPYSPRRSRMHYLEIEQVYFPRIPEFEQREKFLSSLFAMDHWIAGDTTGSMAADFLELLSRHNRIPFKYRSLSMGDTIDIGGEHIDVLWPPKKLDEDKTLKVIKTAIDDFNTAAEEEPSLKQVLDSVGEKGEVKPYLKDGGEVAQKEKIASQDENTFFAKRKNPLPESISKANKSLRAAANHLSLAFHVDNKLLFLGDLEDSELKHTVATLETKNRLKYSAVLMPHHGTHWHADMNKLHARFAVSSTGLNLFPHLSPNTKSISDNYLITYLQGDVVIPPFSNKSRYYRHWVSADWRYF